MVERITFLVYLMYNKAYERLNMKYVIKNPETGKFVSKPNSRSSYTRYLQNARVFDECEVFRHKCGNEIAIPVRDFFEGQ